MDIAFDDLIEALDIDPERVFLVHTGIGIDVVRRVAEDEGIVNAQPLDYLLFFFRRELQLAEELEGRHDDNIIAIIANLQAADLRREIRRLNHAPRVEIDNHDEQAHDEQDEPEQLGFDPRLPIVPHDHPIDWPDRQRQHNQHQNNPPQPIFHNAAINNDNHGVAQPVVGAIGRHFLGEIDDEDDVEEERHAPIGQLQHPIGHRNRLEERPPRALHQEPHFQQVHQAVPFFNQQAQMAQNRFQNNLQLLPPRDFQLPGQQLPPFQLQNQHQPVMILDDHHQVPGFPNNLQHPRGIQQGQHFQQVQQFEAMEPVHQRAPERINELRQDLFFYHDFQGFRLGFAPEPLLEQREVVQQPQAPQEQEHPQLRAVNHQLDFHVQPDFLQRNVFPNNHMQGWQQQRALHPPHQPEEQREPNPEELALLVLMRDAMLLGGDQERAMFELQQQVPRYPQAVERLWAYLRGGEFMGRWQQGHVGNQQIDVRPQRVVQQQINLPNNQLHNLPHQRAFQPQLQQEVQRQQQQLNDAALQTLWEDAVMWGRLLERAIQEHQQQFPPHHLGEDQGLRAFLRDGVRWGIWAERFVRDNPQQARAENQEIDMRQMQLPDPETILLHIRNYIMDREIERHRNIIEHPQQRNQDMQAAAIHAALVDIRNMERERQRANMEDNGARQQPPHPPGRPVQPALNPLAELPQNLAVAQPAENHQDDHRLAQDPHQAAAQIPRGPIRRDPIFHPNRARPYVVQLDHPYAKRGPPPRK